MNKIKIGFLLMLTALIFSCAGVKDKNVVAGNVESIEFGKDGYTAKIKTIDNEIYFATVSIVNVGGPNNYKVFKVGDKVSVKGDFWKTETEKHLTVRTIISSN